MEKRVYGVIGISSIMANWNADFSGYPKTISDGTTFGSDKALKFPMKKMWDNQGKKVLYIKSMKFSQNADKSVLLGPKSLKERYEQLFHVEDLKECHDMEAVLKNLFQATDVKNFGATFAETDNNISITGAVQFGQGFNKHEDTTVEEQQILSPFRDDSKDKKKDAKEKKNSSLGTKIVSSEAHYFYPFAINPLAYKEFVDMKVTEGYTEEDYKVFKQAALCSATAYATNAKEGCENEFALFVETELDLYLPNFSEYISFCKGDEKNTITLKGGTILNEMSEKVQSIEIYYNPLTTIVETDITGAVMKNILTGKEV